MPHSYVSVDILKGSGVLPSTGTTNDVLLRGNAEAVSRELDRFMDRSMQPVAATRYFAGDGSTKLLTGDLISITRISEDTGLDGTFSATWIAADFELSPFNAAPTLENGRPYTGLLVSLASGTQDVFAIGQRNFEIDGTWGFRSVTVDVQASANGAWASASGSLDTGETTPVDIGWTLIVGTEMMYVTSASGTGITVERGANGSTATDHASGATISRFRYPEDVERAAALQVTRLWTRQRSGMANELGLPETGVVSVFRGGLDADVKDLVGGYRKVSI